MDIDEVQRVRQNSGLHRARNCRKPVLLRMEDDRRAVRTSKIGNEPRALTFNEITCGATQLWLTAFRKILAPCNLMPTPPSPFLRYSPNLCQKTNCSLFRGTKPTICKTDAKVAQNGRFENFSQKSRQNDLRVSVMVQTKKSQTRWYSFGLPRHQSTVSS